MSLGKDLASIRKSQNLSLEDIQNAVKIPISTLKSIENDSIFDRYQDNKTYIRSFVRSYGKVLKIDDEEIVKALDAVEDGTYAGDLLSDSEPVFHQDQEDTDTEPEETGPEDIHDDEPLIEQAQPINKTKLNPPPSISTVNWADMGKKFTPGGKNSKAWIIVLAVILVIVVGALGYIFSGEIADAYSSLTSPSREETVDPQSPSQEETEVPAADTLSTSEGDTEVAPDENEAEPDNSQPITLGDSLTVVVYAAYGQLEPIRVTSDFNWRTNPFWMEQGEAYYFDFRDTLLVRGQYSRLLLMFNGHVIENPRQNHFSPEFNSIMLTRGILDRPEYRVPPPQQFPLQVGPPDSIVYRIRY